MLVTFVIYSPLRIGQSLSIVDYRLSCMDIIPAFSAGVGPVQQPFAMGEFHYLSFPEG